MGLQEYREEEGGFGKDKVTLESRITQAHAIHHRWRITVRKTLLSRRILQEKRIAYFPIDGLFGVLADGAPEMGIAYGDTLMERPIKMWKFTKHLVAYFLSQEKDFVLEGDAILPAQVKEMMTHKENVNGITACFIGYTKLTIDEKMEIIKKYRQGDSDWTAGQSDEDMLKYVEEMIEFSKFLKIECEKHDIKFFDISDDFHGTHDEIFQYLFK